MSRAFAWLSAAGLGIATPACSAKDVAIKWLPDDAAVVHCTVAGRQKMPPVLLRTPAPTPPTGLFARRLDPMALNDMGYERDLPVCAGVIVPESSRIEATAKAAESLVVTADTAGREARNALGRCVCDVAYEAGIRDMLPLCVHRAHKAACTPSADDFDKLGKAVEPLRDLVGTIDLPRVHWRLAGKTDRPTWFAEKIRDLLGRHVGGATVYLPGEAIGSRHNHALVRALMDEPGVAAVVREDGGQAILVVRVVEDAMVLDLFVWPSFAPQYRGVLEAIDNAQPERVVAELDKPGAHYQPGLDPTKGSLVAVDRVGLERMDELEIGHARLSGYPYDRTKETWAPPDPLVDRATMQAPFGESGISVDVSLELSAAGRAWASGLVDAPLSPDLSELSLATDPPSYVAAAGSRITPWLRGQPTASTAIWGLSRIGERLRKLEMDYPGSVRGTALEWEIRIPQGSIGFGGALDPAEGLEPIADQITERPFELRAKVTPTHVTASLRPQ
mgnify:CR=1 FL=1